MRQQTKRPSVAVAQTSKDEYTANKKYKAGDEIEVQKSNDCKIWLNNELVVRPNYTTSYGVLLYRRGEPGTNLETNERENTISARSLGIDNIHQELQFEYLLGLIPQGNAWTVFKGLPERDERPEQTAIREFEEETSLAFPYDRDDWKGCPLTSELYAVTSSKKLLHIFLIPAPPELTISKFNVDNVVKIDSGRFSGLPEITEIRFLTKKLAIEGVPGWGKTKIAKIYKSQVSLLERADAILNDKL